MVWVFELNNSCDFNNTTDWYQWLQVLLVKSKCSVAVSLVALIINKEILHCLKNDTDVAQYNFNAHQPILVIFGTDVAERVCYPTSPN